MHHYEGTVDRFPSLHHNPPSAQHSRKSLFLMNPVAPCSNPVRNSNSSSSAAGGVRGGDRDASSTSWPRWTLPDIVEGGDDGLCDVAVETLSTCLHPVLEGLAALDAEVLLELKRKPQQQRYGGDIGGGPVVREGYVRGKPLGRVPVPRVRFCAHTHVSLPSLVLSFVNLPTLDTLLQRFGPPDPRRH